MSDYTVKALGSGTWEAFARLAERHNGVFGGCWCTWFHTFHTEKTFIPEGNRCPQARTTRSNPHALRTNRGRPPSEVEQAFYRC